MPLGTSCLHIRARDLLVGLSLQHSHILRHFCDNLESQKKKHEGKKWGGPQTHSQICSGLILLVGPVTSKAI